MKLGKVLVGLIGIKAVVFLFAILMVGMMVVGGVHDELPYVVGRLPPGFEVGELLWPCGLTIISSYFGERENPTGDGTDFHTGIDMPLPTGSEVVATHAGEVHYAGTAGGYGRLVILIRDDGLQTWYAHLSAFLVERGDRVEAGQVIALSGNTGRSTGPHLHYETRLPGGLLVNPLLLYQPKEEKHGGDAP